ncbi:MAG TPA: hypothetical protein VGK92_02230 [Gaiellales bacterium]|jgi:hypothetical protein
MPQLSIPVRPAPCDVAWRRGLLRSAGLPEELSRALAGSSAHDVHGLLGLVQLGCPVATALRITARDEQAPGT